MREVRVAAGIFSVVLTLVAYWVYFAKIRQGKVPQPVSWLLWCLVTGVVFAVQVREGAGAGSWVTVLTTAICLVLALVGFQRHVQERRKGAEGFIARFDWVWLSIGVVIVLFYLVFRKPLPSAILATLADVVGYGPTIRKGWTNPYSDSATSFLLNSIKFLPSFAAMSKTSLATCIYPAALVVMNALVAAILWERRRHVPEDRQAEFARKAVTARN